MLKRIILYAAVVAMTVTCSCNREKSLTSADSGIVRLDRELASYPSLPSDGRQKFIDENRPLISMATATPDSLVTDSLVSAYIAGRGFTFFESAIESRFTSGDSIDRVLESLHRSLTEMLPELQWGAIVGGVSTYNQSVIMNDSIMYIGLNHYLGSDYEAYDYFEPYQRATKTAAHLPYDVAEAMIARQYPFRPTESSTTLSRMLHEGAIMWVMMKAMPDPSLAEAMGWSEEQLDWTERNESALWNSIISRGLLFSTDPLVADKLTMRAPSTPSLHPDAPGRIGRYIGYRIIDTYIKKHPRFDARTLLSDEFYNSASILIDAGYSPK